jgi:polyhydroxyalkanoate synthase
MAATPRQDQNAAKAAEAVEGGEAIARPTVTGALRGAAGALGQGRVVARETKRLAAELAKVAAGRSEVAPAPGDRRFADPTRTANPAYHRLEQGYLAWAGAVRNVVDSYGRTDADPRRVERAEFAATNLVSALAPTNTLLGNPAAIKHAFETGGTSLLHGARNYLDDLRHNRGMPRMVKPGAMVVGRDLALSPGAVVARDEVAELLQFAPSTPQVHARPVLVIPPPIGRYYFLDLRPGRSFVEYATGRGIQLFFVSWRNPGPEQGEWNLDTYAARVSAAIDEVCEITGSADVDLMGFCAGGIISTTLLSHLAATGDRRVHSMSYAVTLLDFGQRAPVSAFGNAKLLSFARWRSASKGIITSRDMGAAFTWMRPDDLVWNYWVNNYLMGNDPPTFDILAWNADGTNLPGALHGQFLEIFEHNLLPRAGGLSVLGTGVDLSRIDIPTFVTGAVADHLTPWKGCYQTTQLLSGDSTFVLSHSGHIASLVNPPGNPKAWYMTGPAPGPDPEAWYAEAKRQTGSWWENWADWVTERGGALRDAPGKLGGPGHPVLDDAPGRYVRDLDPTAAAAAPGKTRAGRAAKGA